MVSSWCMLTHSRQNARKPRLPGLPSPRGLTSREHRTFERIESLSVDRRSSLAKSPTVCKRICESPMSARDVRKGEVKVGIEMVLEHMFQDAARDPAADVAVLHRAPFQHGWPNLVGMAFCMLPQHQQSLPADVGRPIRNHPVAHPKNEPAMHALVRRHVGASQLSIRRPAMRPKSRKLFVARTRAFSIAVAAIRISASGINCPRP